MRLGCMQNSFHNLGLRSGTPPGGPQILLETLHVRDQRLQIIRREIDGRHAAGVHLRGGMFEEFG